MEVRHNWLPVVLLGKVAGANPTQGCAGDVRHLSEMLYVTGWEQHLQLIGCQWGA